MTLARDQDKTFRATDKIEMSYKGTPVLCLWRPRVTGEVVAELNRFHPSHLRKASDFLAAKYTFGWTAKYIEPKIW
jgi:hypothetical protein